MMDIKSALSRIVQKLRQHANFWDHPEKKIKERGIVCHFIEQLECQFGVLYRLPESIPDSLPHDPPDEAVLGVDGEWIGIEIVELVNEEAITAQIQHDPNYWKISYGFGPTEALRELDEQMRKKDVAAASVAYAFSMYVLLVHCAEPWLDRKELAEALEAHVWPATKGIGVAYLMLDYHPDDQYPVFKLF